MRSHATILLFIGILALGAFFRLYSITEVPPGLYPDEAMNGNNALEALATGNFRIFYPENNGREGLFINIQAAALKLAGNEAWTLRAVSAVFGILTILGIYLLTRELVGKKFQFSAFHFQPIFNYSIFKSQEAIALLSAFFLATSYWHINFSRIGFRAIMVPFFATFGLYFLWKGLGLVDLLAFSSKKSGAVYLIFAGIFIGLGFHTYIAWRFMLFVIAVPILWLLWLWRKVSKPSLQTAESSTAVSEEALRFARRDTHQCLPCAILLFLFITFVVALPIAWYFLENPQDFFGRATDVSIFSAESPLIEFIKSNIATAGMFFFRGDCNWRHNLPCRPELNPLVAFFFAVGLSITLVSLFKAVRNFQFSIFNFQTDSNYQPNNQNASGSLNAGIGKLFGGRSLEFEIPSALSLVLFTWLVFMSLPATLTREGLPHALRSIGMIPPVMIFAGLGAWWIIVKIFSFLERKNILPFHFIKAGPAGIYFPLVFFLLLLIPFATYKAYFIRWANNSSTRDAFSASQWELGKYLDSLPNDIKKYVIVNLPGVDIRGIPAPAQTVMFATDTFREEKQTAKNIRYFSPKNYAELDEELHKINLSSSPFERVRTEKISGKIPIQQNRIVIAPLNAEDKELITKLRKQFPEFKAVVLGNFIILKNY